MDLRLWRPWTRRERAATFVAVFLLLRSDKPQWVSARSRDVAAAQYVLHTSARQSGVCGEKRQNLSIGCRLDICSEAVGGPATTKGNWHPPKGSAKGIRRWDPGPDIMCSVRAPTCAYASAEFLRCGFGRSLVTSCLFGVRTPSSLIPRRRRTQRSCGL